MKYKGYSIHLSKNNTSGMTFYDADVGLIVYSYDQSGDKVVESSPYKGKIIVTYRTDIVQYGLIREDSEWFNYDVISDAIRGNYYLAVKPPFRTKGDLNIYSAIKKAFCKALRNIEIVPDE